MKIRQYVKQRNVNQLAKSVQDIIRDQQDEAGKYETSAKEELEKAIMALSSMPMVNTLKSPEAQPLQGLMML